MRSIYLLTTFFLFSLQLFSIDENSFAFSFKSKGAWCDRAFLGIHSNPLSSEKAQKLGFDNQFGSYVTKVLNNSAAEKAGLKAFDYIFGINEYRVSEEQNLSDLLYKFQPGDEATLHFVRKGKAQTVQVKLGKFGEAEYKIDWAEKSFLGVKPLSDETTGAGVAIKIVEKSTAQEIGLKDGDRIVSINGNPTLDWEDISTAIANTKAGEKIEVSFIRGAQNMTTEGKIKSNSSVWENFGEEIGEEMEEKMEKLSEKMEKWEGKIGDFKWEEDEEDQDSNYPFLGIHSDNVSETKAKKLGFENAYGSYVTRVLPNTAAQKAGLKVFDYIFGIDEYRTGADQSLSAILKKYQPNDKVTLQIYRQGKKMGLPAVLGSKTDVIFENINHCDKAFLGIRNDYESLDEGVKINVVDNSTAKGIGLENGDIIVKINGISIIDWADVSISIDNLEKGKTITVDYLRGGKKMVATGAIKSVRETKGCEETFGNMQFDFDDVRINRSPRLAPTAERPNISNLKVNVENLNSSEAESFRNKFGLDIPSENNLVVNPITVSPNPSEGLFQMQFNLPSSGDTFIRIYNSSGRMIYEYELGNFSGEFSDQVDISQNGTGDYYLIVRQGNRGLTKKIVLQNK